MDTSKDMVIIAGYELVDAGERDHIVAAHRDLVSRARAFAGWDLSMQRAR